MNEVVQTSGKLYVKRHSILVRITHWVNVVCLTVLLMSGLQIFNAHPALYWGNISAFDNPILKMGVARESDGSMYGITTVFDRTFVTNGILGFSKVAEDRYATRGFPSWATLPSNQDLATGRRWHFFFAWVFVINGLLYLAYGLLSGHWRELIPTGAQLRGIGHDIKQHLLLRFPKGEDARSYNVLQKLAYFGVVAVLIPILILAGLAMSPALNAKFPLLLDLFGGRQSARTVHFVAAALLLAFVLVHVLMVLLSGVWNNMRSMITGRYRIDLEGRPHAAE